MERKLAYAHDRDGNKVEGDIQKLVKAVQDGAWVRVLVNDEVRKFQYLFDAQLILLRNETVYAQNTSLVSVSEFEEGEKGAILRFKESCYTNHYSVW